MLLNRKNLFQNKPKEKTKLCCERGIPQKNIKIGTKGDERETLYRQGKTFLSFHSGGG